MNADPRIAPQVTGEPDVADNKKSVGRESFAAEKPRAWRVWLLRIRALLFVTVCATFGVLLIILPWTPKWTDNPLLLSSQGLRNFIASGFVRGVATGLGVLDLWLGFWEAIHYHEMPGNSR